MNGRGRDYAGELAAILAAGNNEALTRFAIELCGKAAEADALKQREEERRARAASRKRVVRRTAAEEASLEVAGCPEPGRDIAGFRETACDNVAHPVTENGVEGHSPSPLLSPCPLPAPNPHTPLNLPNPSRAAQPSAPRRRSTAVRTDGTQRPRRWLTPVAAVWEASKGAGSFPWGQAGKQLKALHQAGHPDVEIAEHLARYLEQTDPRYVSLPRFAATFADYGLSGAPEPIVEDGVLTAYGERETRPPQLPRPGAGRC